MLDIDLKKHAAEFLRYIRNFQYEVAEDGAVMFPRAAVTARGGYFHDVNGADARYDPNLLPDEGLIYLLNAGLRGGTRPASWYLSLFSANYTPAANLTAASYPATASEIVSASEGYTEATRPEWTPTDPTSPVLDNLASKAAFTIATTSNLVVHGAALLSEATKGAVTGTLISATKFSSPRTLYDTDVFNLAYRVQLTSN